MDLEIFNKVDKWAQKGLYIEYYIIDQVENGYEKEVEKGEINPFTYTITVLDAKKDVEIFKKGMYDKLAVGMKEAFQFLEMNI